MFVLEKKGSFEAAHHLEDYAGECCKPHGHTYGVLIRIGVEDAAVADNGIACDFKVLKESYAHFDHEYLNNIEGLPDEFRRNPTAERIAWYIGQDVMQFFREDMDHLLSVEVSIQETETASATWIWTNEKILDAAMSV